MVESEFGVKAAQLHALAAELAAAVSADTSGMLAVEILPEVFGAGRQLDLLTCRLIERADAPAVFGWTGRRRRERLYVSCRGSLTAGSPNGSRSGFEPKTYGISRRVQDDPRSERRWVQ
jgi:hypothetical protein